MGGEDARLQVALARANHAEIRPPRWVVLLHRSHPPVDERIGTALWYRQWLDRHGEQDGRTLRPGAVTD